MREFKRRKQEILATKNTKVHKEEKEEDLATD
jgi:hypothetical protein